MYSLPRDTRISIREVTRDFRKNILWKAFQGWSGKRVSVFLSSEIEANIEREYDDRTVVRWSSGRSFFRYSPFDGTCNAIRPQELYDVRWTARTSVEVNVESIVIEINLRNFRTSELLLYVDKFVANPEQDPAQGDLDVARDCLLDGDVVRGSALAKRALPFGWPLFTALIERERTMLQGNQKYRVVPGSQL